jgi:ATP-dependent DNA helicase RecG
MLALKLAGWSGKNPSSGQSGPEDGFICPQYVQVRSHGKKLLHIYVPESSQVHRCNGRIYDRNKDGDLDITDHTVQVAQLYQRKQATYSENRVYPWIQPRDLRADLIDRCRRHVRINRKNHPWTDMGDASCSKAPNWCKRIPHPANPGSPLPA